MQYVAALYTSKGKVVTGQHHGEAFSKLIGAERDELISGFLDPITGKFISDDIEFYAKKMVCLRHSEVDYNEEDPGINPQGRTHSMRAALFVKQHVEGINTFQGICSPSRRCVETAGILSETLNIEFEENCDLVDVSPDESLEDFVGRVKSVLRNIPVRSIIVSHCNLIANLVRACYGCGVDKHPEWKQNLPKTSVTYLDGPNLVWMGRHDFVYQGYDNETSSQSRPENQVEA